MPDVPLTQYKQILDSLPWRSRMHTRLRGATLSLLSLSKRIDRTSGWIRFPYYHHIYDDERRQFAAHLDYLRRFGDFISYDQGVDLLVSGAPIDGRYFCISFDDSNKDCLRNGLPILAEKKISATFFLTVERIAAPPFTASSGRGWRWINEFLDWQDCRKLADAGMILGSHGYGHRSFAELSEAEALGELQRSREKIQAETRCPCDHFSCPWGNPLRHLKLNRETKLAQNSGYRSLSTSQRGAMRRGDSPYSIRRDQLQAAWSLGQLRYFLSR